MFLCGSLEGNLKPSSKAAVWGIGELGVSMWAADPDAAEDAGLHKGLNHASHETNPIDTLASRHCASCCLTNFIEYTHVCLIASPKFLYPPYEIVSFIYLWYDCIKTRALVTTALFSCGMPSRNFTMTSVESAQRIVNEIWSDHTVNGTIGRIVEKALAVYMPCIFSYTLFANLP